MFKSLHKIHLITKNFAHHSNHSGYDRLLDFIPCAPLRTLPFSRFFSSRFKEQKISNCLAKWDHYQIDEIERELNILLSIFPVYKHIIHFLYSENTFCYSTASNRRNKVFLGTYHQPERWYSSSGKPRFQYFTSRMKQLDGIIALSNDQADFLKTFNDNVFCVHHGIDIDFFKPQPAPTRDPHTCIFVGNWLRDFETLNRCAEIIKETAPEIKIQVVTPPKNLQLLRASHFEVFSGISDFELREKYQNASVALLPLMDCTANNSALEAMSCGVPVVVSDIGGIRDYVTEDFGVFCTPGNADEMAHAVTQLLGNQEKLARMSTSARKRAEDHFAWPVIARQMNDVYARYF